MRPRRHIPTSATRDILRRIEGSDAMNFSAGLPAAELLPVDEVRAAVDRVLRKDPVGSLSYATTEGHAPLRELVAERLLRPRGLDARAEQILITSGAQQGLDLVAKALVDGATEVMVERPTYLAALQAFALLGGRFTDVPLGPAGVDPEAVDHALADSRPAFFYSVPSFHNPTGACVPASRHERLAEVLHRHRVGFVEDTPYLELSYEGPVPGCLSRLLEDRAIVLGSASKLVAPGLRLGWLWTRSPVMEQMNAARQAADLCGSAFTQRVLFEVLSGMNIEAHLQRLRAEYRHRRDVMVEAIRAQFPAGTSFDVPAGGMFLWVALPAALSSRELLRRALPRGVVFTPGASFFACEPRPDNYLRLNFTGTRPDRIREGVAVLAEELAQLRDASGQAAA